MARFCGMIGFAQSVQSAPGVYDEIVVEHLYTGEILRNTKRWEPGDQRNDDLSINNTISIIANSFALDNCAMIRYVCLLGSKWKVNSVDIQRPRLVLMLGGVYNG